MKQTKDTDHRWYCTSRFMIEINRKNRKVGLYTPLFPLGSLITRNHAAYLLRNRGVENETVTI